MSTKQKLLLASLFVAPTAVQAHPGHHSEIAIFELVEHTLNSPFHIGFIGGAILLAYTLYRLAKSVSSKSNEVAPSKLATKSAKDNSE